MTELRTRPVTEAEAASFLCPFTLGPALSEAFGCRGSRCMLWRWKNYGVSGEPTTPTGFCGAGGDPS